MNIKKISLGFVLFTFLALLGAGLAADKAKAVAAAPLINRDLTLGAYGADVQSLQQFLNNNGYVIAAIGAGSPGRETYYFGNLTRNALIRFQSAHGIAATGYFDQATRTLLAGIQTGIIGTTGITGYTNYINDYYPVNRNDLLGQIEALKQRLADLKQQLADLSDDEDNDNNGSDPYIVSIKVYNGGDDGYIDTGDSIKITFSEPVDPESINDDLDEGDYVSNVPSYQIGGFSVSSSGRVTINNIAEFDMGQITSSGTFTSKIALDSAGRVLTITLSSGGDFKITDEDFSNAYQIGGTVEDLNGNEMESDSNIDDPTGTFGGDNEDSDNPYITAIEVADGGDNDYIDTGDSIKITFSEPVDPESINDDLDEGDYVSNVPSYQIGGFSVSSSGMAMIEGIAKFDVGEVKGSGSFTAKLYLNSSGRILTVTLTGGNDVEIDEEDFQDAAQIGGAVEDRDGNEMKGDSDIDDPTGTFGGDRGDDEDNPYIEAISVYNGGDNDYIDTGDSIKITFSEPVDPESINDDLDEGDYISGIASDETGGVSVSSSGMLVISDIAEFDVGEVDRAQNYTVKLALSSSGRLLTITLTGGNDVEIEDEDFAFADQTGGTVEDLNGNEMEDVSNAADPAGSF